MGSLFPAAQGVWLSRTAVRVSRSLGGGAELVRHLLGRHHLGPNEVSNQWVRGSGLMSTQTGGARRAPCRAPASQWDGLRMRLAVRAPVSPHAHRVRPYPRGVLRVLHGGLSCRTHPLLSCPRPAQRCLAREPACRARTRASFCRVVSIRASPSVSGYWLTNFFRSKTCWCLSI
jgi:hypothetical protein